MIADLLQIKDGFRFVSFEPLIEAVDPTMIVCNHPAHNARGTLNALTGSWWPSIGDADAEERQRIDSDAKIDWVLAGCESGPRRRPMNPDWARSLRDQCRDAGVPFYLKQMEIGGKVTASPALDGVEQNEFPGGE